MKKKLIFALVSLLAYSTRAQDGQVLAETPRYDEETEPTADTQEIHADWNDWNVALPDDAAPIQPVDTPAVDDTGADAVPDDQEFHADWIDWNVGLPADAVAALQPDDAPAETDAVAADAAPEDEKDDQEFHVDWTNWEVAVPEEPAAEATAPATDDQTADEVDNGEFHVDWTNWEVAVPEEPAAESSSNTSLRPNSGN